MKESLPRKIWRTVYPALLLIGIYLLIYFLAVLAQASFFYNKYPLPEDFMAEFGDLISVIALTAGLGICYILYGREPRVPGKSILKRPGYLAGLALMGILVCFGFNVLVSLGNLALGQIGGTAAEGAVYKSGTWQTIIMIIKSVILAPAAEELAFRGLVFGRCRFYLEGERAWTGGPDLRPGRSFWISAAVSSLLFGIYHFNAAQGIYAFLCGMVMCLVYLRFRNLWAPAVFHAAANAFTLVLAYTGMLDGVPVWGWAVLMAAAFAAGYLIWKHISSSGEADNI